MATSNSTDFTQTRNEIIEDALTLIGAIGIGDTPESSDYTFCSKMLNKMIKGWEAQGIHLWTEVEAALFLVDNQNEYVITTSSDRAGDNVVNTTLSAAGTASATTLTLTSTSGMTAADAIGIVLDSGSLQWTTIVSVDSTTAVTITTGLTSVAASGNNIFTYTNRVDRPLRITAARFRDSSFNDRPIKILGRQEFMNIATKTAEGAINSIYYSPGVSTCKLYVWPTPTSSEETLRFSYTRRIQDFDSSSDNADLPQEWLETLTYNLCVRIAPAYGKSLSRMNPDLISLAVSTLSELQLWDSEESSIKVVPNYKWD